MRNTRRLFRKPAVQGRLLVVLLALMVLVGLSACEAAVESEMSPIKIANPASIFCKDQGGQLVTEFRTNIGEYGVCVFEGNYKCEEWAMYRNRCPIGGIDVTMYTTIAAQYCALTGGNYTATNELGTQTEQGFCTFQNGTQCDVWGYFSGECQVEY